MPTATTATTTAAASGASSGRRRAAVVRSSSTSASASVAADYGTDDGGDDDVPQRQKKKRDGGRRRRGGGGGAKDDSDNDVDNDSGYDDSSPSVQPFLPLEEHNHDNNDNDNNDHFHGDDGGGGGDSDYSYDNDGTGTGSGAFSEPAKKRQHQRRSLLRRKEPSSSSLLRRTSASASVASRAMMNRFLNLFPKKMKKIKISAKALVSASMCFVIGMVVWDSVFTPPERRMIKPESSMILLEWVQEHPVQGLLAILLVIAGCVVVMVPLGTPLTLGCGYVYKGAYGWKLGVAIATAVSMGGSALGAVLCFLLGRYLMRDTVRKWIKAYPLFVAIDVGKCVRALPT